VSKAKATKAKRKAKADEAPPTVANPARPEPAAESVAVPTLPSSATRAAIQEAAASQRWEERTDKDAYALDLLERLVRYFAGRASATSSEAMRSTAFVLSTLSLGLASEDEEQLVALAGAARGLRKGPASHS